MSEKQVEFIGSETVTGRMRVKLDIELPHKDAMAILTVIRDHELAEQKAAEALKRKEEAEARKAEAAARKAAKTEAAKAKRGKTGEAGSTAGSTGASNTKKA